MKPSPFMLAFDCACSALSVAVLEGQTVVAQHFETAATGQSATLAPAIQRTLQQAGIGSDRLGLIGVTSGPGSFTGIRIGLAMARGLALALDAPLAACSTFEAVAHNLPPHGADQARTVLAIDSRREEMFLALDTPQQPFIARPDDAVAALPRGRYALAGDGAGLLRAAFETAGRGGEIAASDERPPVAAIFAPALAALGAEHWRQRNRREGMPRPLYLREADVTLPRPVGWQ
ncbi:MAG: tRNA (adenosine(37)-N6)-threonylcarbamoyltransferase complex dimerization subunit type 1 TsaB [Reyranellaceae bacterium]